MKKGLKIALISLGSLLGLALVAVVIAVWMVLTPSRLTGIVNNLSSRFVQCETHFGKVDLIGTGREIEVNHRFAQPCTELAVVLNASAACPGDKLDEVVTGAAKAVSEQYQLEMMIFKKECFGMCD